MDRIAVRVGLALSLALGVLVGAAQPSSASTGCSLDKQAHSVPVYYHYCDIVPPSTSARWQSWVFFTNNLGRSVRLEGQVNLRIDGVDHGLGNVPVTVPAFNSIYDPYNKGFADSVGVLIKNKCTLGHLYFPIVKFRLLDADPTRAGDQPGFWGDLAGAGEFTCA